jgi:hypothetical protein
MRNGIGIVVMAPDWVRLEAFVAARIAAEARVADADPTENRIHSASFHSDERTAPSRPVAKHLVPKANDCPDERSIGATVGASTSAPRVVLPRQTTQPPANGIVWP